MIQAPKQIRMKTAASTSCVELSHFMGDIIPPISTLKGMMPGTNLTTAIYEKLETGQMWRNCAQKGDFNQFWCFTRRSKSS